LLSFHYILLGAEKQVQLSEVVVVVVDEATSA
jgi:hypothetical protein